MHRLLVRTFTMPALLAILSLGCSEAHSKADVERTAGDSLHDASITMRIKTTYLFDGHLNPFRINVDTRDGVVTLHGTVPSDVHRDLAGEIAKNADGVKDVDNQLRIAPEGGDGPDEAEKSFGQAVHDASTSASIRSGTMPASWTCATAPISACSIGAFEAGSFTPSAASPGATSSSPVEIKVTRGRRRTDTAP